MFGFGKKNAVEATLYTERLGERGHDVNYDTEYITISSKTSPKEMAQLIRANWEKCINGYIEYGVLTTGLGYQNVRINFGETDDGAFDITIVFSDEIIDAMYGKTKEAASKAILEEDPVYMVSSDDYTEDPMITSVDGRARIHGANQVTPSRPLLFESIAYSIKPIDEVVSDMMDNLGTGETNGR